MKGKGFSSLFGGNLYILLSTEVKDDLRGFLEADALSVSVYEAYLWLLVLDHLSAVIGERISKGVLLNRYLPELLLYLTLGQLLIGI